MQRAMYITDAAMTILARPRKRLPTRDTFCKCISDAVEAGEPLSKALRMASRDEATAGGGPDTPAPGDDYTARVPNFMPNAAGTINERIRVREQFAIHRLPLFLKRLQHHRSMLPPLSAW